MANYNEGEPVQKRAPPILLSGAVSKALMANPEFAPIFQQLGKQGGALTDGSGSRTAEENQMWNYVANLSKQLAPQYKTFSTQAEADAEANKLIASSGLTPQTLAQQAGVAYNRQVSDVKAGQHNDDFFGVPIEVATALTLGGIGAGIAPGLSSAFGGGTLGGAGAGAVIGGGNAFATGGDVLKGALTGGALGGAGSYVKGLLPDNMFGSTPTEWTPDNSQWLQDLPGQIEAQGVPGGFDFGDTSWLDSLIEEAAPNLQSFSLPGENNTPWMNNGGAADINGLPVSAAENVDPQQTEQAAPWSIGPGGVVGAAGSATVPTTIGDYMNSVGVADAPGLTSMPNASTFGNTMTTGGILGTGIGATGGFTGAANAGTATGLGGLLGSVANGAASGAGSTLGGALTSAGVGALLGSVDGSKQSGTNVSTVEPWSAQQPYLKDLFAKAQTTFNAQPSINPLQTQALSEAGANSDPTANWFGAGGKVGTNAYAGMENPYLKQSIDYANEDVNRAMMPMLNKANRASGSFGNSGVAETYSRSMADQFGRNANTARMNNYNQQLGISENDVNRRFQGAMNAPTLQNQSLQNATNKFSLGAAAQAQPYDALKQYGSLITGNYGKTSSSPIYTNPLSGLLGGAVAGSSIYKNLFGGP